MYINIYCLASSDLDKNRSISFSTILQHQHQQVTSGTVSAGNSCSWTEGNRPTAIGDTEVNIQMGTGILGDYAEGSTHCHCPLTSMAKLGKMMQATKLEDSIVSHVSLNYSRVVQTYPKHAYMKKLAGIVVVAIIPSFSYKTLSCKVYFVRSKDGIAFCYRLYCINLKT